MGLAQGCWQAGDIARGASRAVWDIRDGRDAADAILADLGAKQGNAAQ